MIDEKTFVCGIGAQKAGTTFLADYFSKHPEFMMSDLKELHYFDVKYRPDLSEKFDKNFRKKIVQMADRLANNKNVDTKLFIALIKRIEAFNKNDYRSYFKYYIEKNHSAFGEITPAYSMLDRDAFKEIISNFPNHKFIFLLRNPIDRFWSQVNFEIKNYEHDINPLDVIEKRLNKERYILRSNYKKTLIELLSVVDNSSVCVEFFENIFSDKGPETIEKISKFVGIEYRDDLLNIEKKINTTKYIETMDDMLKQKIFNKFSDVYKYIIDNYENVPNSWKDDYLKYGSI